MYPYDGNLVYLAQPIHLRRHYQIARELSAVLCSLPAYLRELLRFAIPSCKVSVGGVKFCLKHRWKPTHFLCVFSTWNKNTGSSYFIGLGPIGEPFDGTWPQFWMTSKLRFSVVFNTVSKCSQNDVVSSYSVWEG